jgi:DNA repair photolyase
MEIRQQQPKTIINRNVHHFDFDATFNPYRGCSHACKYCYARDTHQFFNLDRGNDFERIIFAKDFTDTQLMDQLSRVPLSHSIAIGTATDPYQPLEARLRVTRKFLQAILVSGHGVSITTKSPLVLRDLDLLTNLAAHQQIVVHISLITNDKAMAHQLEPGTSSPRRRWQIVDGLVSHQVPVALFCAPIIPAWTDDYETLAQMFAIARQKQVSWLMAAPVHFSQPMFEYFSAHLAMIDATRTLAFRRHFADSGTLLPWYRRQLQQTIDRLRSQYHFSAQGPVPRPHRITIQPVFDI